MTTKNKLITTTLLSRQCDRIHRLDQSVSQTVRHSKTRAGRTGVSLLSLETGRYSLYQVWKRTSTASDP